MAPQLNAAGFSMLSDESRSCLCSLNCRRSRINRLKQRSRSTIPITHKSHPSSSGSSHELVVLTQSARPNLGGPRESYFLGKSCCRCKWNLLKNQ